MIVNNEQKVKKKHLLGVKFRQIRKQHQFSQQAFAEKLGFSKSYIADIEGGRIRPSRNLLEAVQNKLGISVDSIFKEERMLAFIEMSKGINPLILFIYAFTQGGIADNEAMLRNLLTGWATRFIDAAGLSSRDELFEKITETRDSGSSLYARLKAGLTSEDLILILKSMSQSRIQNPGETVRDLFKIIQTDWNERREERAKRNDQSLVESSCVLVLLDYPSFLEKNMESFGYYAHPEYSRPSILP